jgi:hypothetical protein
VRQTCQLRIHHVSAEKTQSYGQTLNHTSRYGDGRIARYRCQGSARDIARPITVDIISEPRRPTRRGDDGIQLMRLQCLVNSLLSNEFTGLQRVNIRVLGQRTLGLDDNQNILTEERHGKRTVLLVLSYHCRKVAGRRAILARDTLKVGVHIGLEFI